MEKKGKIYLILAVILVLVLAALAVFFLSKCEMKPSDVQPPGVPSGLLITRLSPYEITLSWSPSTDNKAVVEYRVYQGKALVEAVKATSVSYGGLVPGSVYCYSVSATDSSGNESGRSDEVCTERPATPPKPEKKPPAPPTAPVLKATAASPTRIDLSWNVPKAELGILAYNVYKEGVIYRSVRQNSAEATGLQPETHYCFTVTALDKGKTESVHSNEACATTFPRPDDKPPTVPTGLKAEGISPTEINLSWNPSRDDKAVTGYNVYYRGTLLRAERKTSTVHARLNPATKYCYTVTAYDAAGNESGHSEEACGTTLAFGDTTPPSVPLGLQAVAISPTQVDVKWMPSTDNVGVTGYNVFRNGEFFKTVQSTTISSKETDLSVPVCFTVSAIDAAGNESAKSQQSCATLKAVGAKGTVWAGGGNDFGQVGDGSTTYKGTLVQATGLTNIVRVAAGVEHTLAVRKDGTVWAWGSNSKGQLGDGTYQNSPVPVQAKNLTEVVEVAAGWSHSVALKKDGTVWAWGRNGYGQLGTGGLADMRSPARVAIIDDAVAIAAGYYHTLAVRKDGSVWAWGWNIKGQLGDGTGDDSNKPVRVKNVTGAIAVAAGASHSAVLMKDGSLWMWGWNDFGQMGKGTMSSDKNLPSEVKGLTGIKAIAAGDSHTVALKRDGTVWAWGMNDFGQLGDGSTVSKGIPTRLIEFNEIEAIAACAKQTAALKSDGTLWVWGWNTKTKPDKPVPKRFSGLSGITALAVGMEHVVGLKAE